MKNYFGTDGVRARVGSPRMTPEFVLKLGFCAGLAFKEAWQKSGRPTVYIGKDTRISGYLIESALESGFSAAGVDVALLGPVPTPAIAYLTRTFHGAAGVVVSASHNAYEDNGIKFFSGRGRKLDDALEARINHYLHEYIDAPLPIVHPAELGKAHRIDDAKGRYIEHCKSSFPPRLDLNGLHIILDCANGATYQVAPAVFHELGAKIEVLFASPNGLNINENCGSTDTRALRARVIEQGADLGIAFDGDGDRLAVVTRDGQALDGDAILYVITRGLIAQGQKPEGVVGTVMTNLGAIESFARLGVDFAASAVGDRHVMTKLQEKGWVVGGEASGHIIDLEHSTTGDGIVAALQVLKALRLLNQPIEEVLADYRIYPMTTQNIAVSETTDKTALLADETFKAAIAEVEQQLAQQGRVLVRASGTEPKIRITVEAKQSDLVAKHIAFLSNTLTTVLKQRGE